jgi:hypothetical protein
MTTSVPTKAEQSSPARDDLFHPVRRYLGGRRGWLILAVVAIVAGGALNWSWLVAAGIAPVLITALPCLAMCGLGLCMNKLIGGSASQPSPQSGTALPAEPSAPTGGPLAGMSSCCGAGAIDHGSPNKPNVA